MNLINLVYSNLRQTFTSIGHYFLSAVGFSSGRVTVVDGLILADVGLDETKSDFYHCHDSIEKVAFSYDCRYLASSVSVNQTLL